MAIFVHGGGGDKNVPNQGATQAANGIATIYINDVGHGFGPLGTLTVDRNGPPAVTFPAGGRGRDQDGDHIIGDLEGVFALPPRAIIQQRDAETQTVVDLMQLVRIIQVGVDVDGDGIPDLDPSRIYVFGQSFGGMISLQLLAVEPNVMAGVSISACAPFAEFERLSPPNRQFLERFVANRTPSLLNPPGVTSIDAVPVTSPPYFDENLPLRDGVPYTVGLQDGTRRIIQAPVTNTIPGATELQEVIGHLKWVMMSGNSLAYAPHLWKAPLPGVPAKSVIFMFPKGDQNCGNPTQSALVRAGDLLDRTTYYRHDLAFAENPTLPKDPHVMTGFLLFGDIALGGQRQIATFFASHGSEIIHPEPARFFEVPIQGPLPEDLNFIP